MPPSQKGRNVPIVYYLGAPFRILVLVHLVLRRQKKKKKNMAKCNHSVPKMGWLSWLPMGKERENGNKTKPKPSKNRAEK